MSSSAAFADVCLHLMLAAKYAADGSDEWIVGFIDRLDAVELKQVLRLIDGIEVGMIPIEELASTIDRTSAAMGMKFRSDHRQFLLSLRPPIKARMVISNASATRRPQDQGMDAYEIQQRILAELEEAGFEDIFSIINIVFAPTGGPLEPSLLKKSLIQLIAKKHVLLGFHRINPRMDEMLVEEKSRQLAMSLDEWLRFDPARSHWTHAKGDMRFELVPEVIITDAGHEQAMKILERRGYQWWRKKAASPSPRRKRKAQRRR